MGACTIRMEPRLSCERGLPAFYSTGGDAFFTGDSSHLVIRDSKQLIVISTLSGDAKSFLVPPVPLMFGLASRPRFIRKAESLDTNIRVECEDGFHKNKLVLHLSLMRDEGWMDGLETKPDGVLPSTYIPDYEAIAKERGDA